MMRDGLKISATLKRVNDGRRVEEKAGIFRPGLWGLARRTGMLTRAHNRGAESRDNARAHSASGTGINRLSNMRCLPACAQMPGELRDLRVDAARRKIS